MQERRKKSKKDSLLSNLKELFSHSRFLLFKNFGHFFSRIIFISYNMRKFALRNIEFKLFIQLIKFNLQILILFRSFNRLNLILIYMFTNTSWSGTHRHRDEYIWTKIKKKFKDKHVAFNKNGFNNKKKDATYLLTVIMSFMSIYIYMIK